MTNHTFGTSARAALACLACAALCIAGCSSLGALIGGMADSYRRTTPRSVAADYLGLTGKSFAVLVSADRMVESQHPGIATELVGRISERLRQNAGASGYVPPVTVIGYIANNPGWLTRTHEELAKDLGGVERLIIVELTDFSTNEMGNQYIWDGVAGGTLGVAETDGTMVNDFSYQKSIRVKFPDKSGTSSSDMSRELVVGALLERFVDRCTWLFYEHDELYYITY